MNFNLYLADPTAKELDRIAERTSTPRNALIRAAVDAWLAHRSPAWPREVLDFAGDASVAPFESHRTELRPSEDDPFATPTPPTTRRRSPRARREVR